MFSNFVASFVALSWKFSKIFNPPGTFRTPCIFLRKRLSILCNWASPIIRKQRWIKCYIPKITLPCEIKTKNEALFTFTRTQTTLVEIQRRKCANTKRNGKTIERMRYKSESIFKNKSVNNWNLIKSIIQWSETNIKVHNLHVFIGYMCFFSSSWKLIFIWIN